MKPDSRIAILDGICDVEESEKPFGKRWHQEEIVLRAKHVAALQEGNVLALDVCEEYVVFLTLDPSVTANLNEEGFRG